MIKEYLDIPITKDWYRLPIYERRNYIHNFNNDLTESNENIKRTKISVIEIWSELLNGEAKSLPPVKATEIRGILESLEGWSRCTGNRGQLRFGKEYGKQTAYTKLN